MIKEIVILSGKGGTGKTSIAAALAMTAGDEATLADCDVDASNMHLLLKPDFGHSEEFFSGVLPHIQPELCSQCGICMDHCRFNAIHQAGAEFLIDPYSCEGCAYCSLICPTKAITLKPRLSGQLYISQTKTGNTLVHARLDIAEGNSGKLVAKVKGEARKIAEKSDSLFIIVDGPPGIGCPAISSLAGANLVVIVTEPTVSGINDLTRLLKLIQRFRIKAACIINKYDQNLIKSDEIHTLLEQNNIIHLADIPFDLEFTKAMTEGKTIVETDSRLAEIIRNLWLEIKII